MTATLLDGRKIAKDIQRELKPRIDALRDNASVPTLAMLLIGTDPASVVFVRNKEQTAKALGIRTRVQRLGRSVPFAKAQTIVRRWSQDPDIHGIIVQLPLPEKFDVPGLLSYLPATKDVDCLHPENIGLLALGTPRFLPPTPAAIQQLLVRSGITLPGKHVVIVGRSPLVGKPLALTLLQKHKHANATVTVCHRATRHLERITALADVLVVATGVPHSITAAHVRPGSVVIDVSTHKTARGWTGDVDRVSVRRVASAMSLVPGGVGPMTVTMLLTNVVQAAEGTFT